MSDLSSSLGYSVKGSSESPVRTETVIPGREARTAIFRAGVNG